MRRGQRERRERGVTEAVETRRVLAAVLRSQAQIERKLDELLLRESAAAPGAEGVWVDARWVAERYGVGADWVRRHKAELGYRHLGTGKRPRLRFQREAVERAMPELIAEEPEPAKQRPPRARKRPAKAGVDLLPIGPKRRMSSASVSRQIQSGAAPLARPAPRSQEVDSMAHQDANPERRS
jgi:hypothetical protein